MTPLKIRTHEHIYLFLIGIVTIFTLVFQYLNMIANYYICCMYCTCTCAFYIITVSIKNKIFTAFIKTPVKDYFILESAHVNTHQLGQSYTHQVYIYNYVIAYNLHGVKITQPEMSRISTNTNLTVWNTKQLKFPILSILSKLSIIHGPVNICF